MTPETPPQRRSPGLVVWMTPQEKQALEIDAHAARMPMAAYIREALKYYRSDREEEEVKK